MSNKSIELVLIRGLPGSGKSTLAKNLQDEGGVPYFHVEADMFFTDKEGNYIFEGSKIAEAHDWCQKHTAISLEDGKNTVVSNTFSRLWEMEPYFNMAFLLNVPVRVLEATGNYPNVHNCSSEVIERMRNRWEPYE